MKRLTLFWRTFLLIGALLAFTLAAALWLARSFDRSPPEQSLAWEIGSLINLTRSALVSSSSDRRIALLNALQTEEQVQIVPMEPNDKRITFAQMQDPRASQVLALQARLAEAMPNAPTIYLKINGREGLWVSFDIDDDSYWLRFSLDRLDRQIGPPGGLLALIVVGLALIGALVLSQTINRPLRTLSQAITQLGQPVQAGAVHEPAPVAMQDGPAEIVAINQQFAQMAQALRQADTDRSVTLAGVSHDLRTPLSRLRLGLEMAPMPADDRAAMVEDIEQIDHIVGQFVEYGRAANQAPAPLDLMTLDAAALEALRLSVESSWRLQLSERRLVLHWDTEPAQWQGAMIDIQRIINNLIENALRYGYRLQPTPFTEVWVGIKAQGSGLQLEVSDAGVGIDGQDRDRLMRPFSRGETARTQVAAGGLGPGGSGLGLAIVMRLALRYQGTVALDQAAQGGLRVKISLGSA